MGGFLFAIKTKAMITKTIQTRIFKEGEDLLDFICSYIKDLKEESILVVTSKIVALAESRTAMIYDEQTKIKLIKSESQWAMPTKYVWLTIKDGTVMAAAGIDESNANGKLILLPKDSFRTALELRRKLKRKFRLKNLGVIITDSRTVPLRAGVIGMAIGYAGFKGVKDYRGTLDIFGRKFHFSRTDVADSLAAAAVVVMGEGRERRPLAILEKTPAVFCDRIQKRELHIDPQDDMYGPLFKKLK